MLPLFSRRTCRADKSRRICCRRPLSRCQRMDAVTGVAIPRSGNSRTRERAWTGVPRVCIRHQSRGFQAVIELKKMLAGRHFASHRANSRQRGALPTARLGHGDLHPVVVHQGISSIFPPAQATFDAGAFFIDSPSSAYPCFLCLPYSRRRRHSLSGGPLSPPLGEVPVFARGKISCLTPGREHLQQAARRAKNTKPTYPIRLERPGQGQQIISEPAHGFTISSLCPERPQHVGRYSTSD